MNQRLKEILDMDHYDLYNEVVLEMEDTWQIECIQSIMNHGRRVCEETDRIMGMLENKDSELPEFLIENSEFILANIVNPATRHLYTVFHDCGKPFCEADNWIRFKDHESISHLIIQKLYPENKELHNLVLNDMKIHKVRASNYDEFLKTSNLVTHIIVGLAEMYANSSMFGGRDSDSFKIKYKNYCKFACRALNWLKTQ